MTQVEKEKRAAKASTLQVAPMADDIHRREDGRILAGRWLVTCESDPALRHQVRYEGAPTQRWVCSCPDYRHHREDMLPWECKHILAAQKSEKWGEGELRVPIKDRNPQGVRRGLTEMARQAREKAAIGFAAPQLSAKERIELECQAMFGDMEAAAILNGKPVRASNYEPAPAVEVPRTAPAAQAPALEDGAAEGWELIGEWQTCPVCGRSLPDGCTCGKGGDESPPQPPYDWRKAEAERQAALRAIAELPGPAPVELLEKAGLPKGKAALPVPKGLAGIHAALCRPFPIAQVEVKPGAIANGKALALAFVDSRAYQARLDEIAGPDGWSVEYRPLGERAVICRLTILGVTREDVGEADPAEANWATCMIAQAFKRACAAFGLGRYLYGLPRVWAELSGKAIKDPEAAIQRLYAGIKA